MAPSSDPELGGHSWNPVEAVCLNCHPGSEPPEIDGFDTDMALLKSLLEQAVGEQYVLDADGNPVGTGVPIVGLILDDYPDPGETDRSQPGIWTVEQAQAAWNYMTLLEDQSKGIHNPDYAKALLQNSIEALQDN